MTEHEKILHSWLHQACALLSVEARDHEENREYDGRLQRREIAKVLKSFLAKADNILEDMKSD